MKYIFFNFLETEVHRTDRCFTVQGKINAFIPQQTRPIMVQLLACGLFGAKPFSEPTLAYIINLITVSHKKNK